MNRDHGSFAAELRADAARLREMADALDARANNHARIAGIPVETVRRHRQEIDEDRCAFGLRFVGSSLAPTLDCT